MKHSLVFIILILLLSFASAELIIDGLTIPTLCGETNFMEIDEDGFEYLIYNDCQEWRFPQILTNIKTTFKEEQLNAKVIPINISEMNQNGTPLDYSDDYPVRTLAISSINVTPQWGGNDKRLEWHTYYIPETVDIALYYKLNGNSGKWGLELDGWDFDSPTNYIRLQNQIFSGGEFVEFDCSNITATRECSFLDEGNNKFSTLYFDYPENEGQTYTEGIVWYSQQGQNHNLYQDLGRGNLIILDPTITTDIIGVSGFVNNHDRPQCSLQDGNFFCIGKYDTKVLRITTATLPLLDDWTLADWNFTPRPDLFVIQPIVEQNDTNMILSYIWAISSSDRNVVLSIASSDYMTENSWDTVSLISGGKKQVSTVDINSSNITNIVYGTELSNTHSLNSCEDCTNQANVSDKLDLVMPDTIPSPTIFTGRFIDDNNYVVLVDDQCSIGTWDRTTTITASLSLSEDNFSCSAGALKIANDRLYLTYTNLTTDIGYIIHADKDANLTNFSNWSTPISISINFPLSYSMVFIDGVESIDFNSLLIAYSEGGSELVDHNRFVGYRKFDTATNTFTTDFIVIDENVEDYSESRSVDAHYDSSRNNVYIIYDDQNTNNINPGVFLTIVSVGVSGSIISSFDAIPGALTDLNILYALNDTSTIVDTNELTYQWDINSVTFSTDQNTTRSLSINIDFNICLTVFGTAFDGNSILNQSCQVISPSAGSIKMYFTDENTGAVLPEIAGTFNSVAYSVDSNGFIEFDLIGLSPGDYTVTASDENRSERLFTFTLKSSDTFEVNAAMLEDTKGRDIEFQFFGTDEETLLTDSNITIFNLENGRTVYRQQKTDSSGRVIFFLNPSDSQYQFVITGEVEDVNYGSIDFIVKSPKREVDGSLITPINFDAHLTSIGDELFSDASGDVTFKIYGNTFNKYKLSVDVNADFFERKYDIQARGDEDPLILQPYLVSAAEGVSTKIITQSSIDFKPIGKVTVNIFKFITGEGRILIESVITDDKGEAFISGITNDEYEFEVFFKNELIATPNITVTSSVIFIQFNPFTFDIKPIESQVSVVFNPNRQKLISGENILTQAVSIRNGSIDTIRIFTLDENFSAIGYDLTFGGVSDGLTNTILLVPDLNGWDQNSIMYLTVRVTYEGRIEDFNMIYLQYQPFKSGDVVLNILMNLIRVDVGCGSDSTEPCTELVFISLILTILLCGVMVIVTPLRDPAGILGMSMLFMAFFTFLGWIPIFWFVVYCFVCFSGMLTVWRLL